MTRDEIIKGLDECANNRLSRGYCPYIGTKEYFNVVMRDAIALLKRSFTPQEVYDTVIEYGQHDKRFKLGDKIDYSFTKVVDILNIELMRKAGDV